MHSRSTLLVVVVLGLFSRLHAEVPQFRSGVELVPVTVTVTDRQGRYITDLRAEEFSLSDNGVPARAELFERQRAAVALVIVVDSSSSMSDRLPALKQAAANLLKSLRPGDSAAIVDCDASATLIAPMSDDVAAVGAALETVTAGGTTALHDAVLRASMELEASVRTRGAQPQRPVIVVFSDGADTASSAAANDVLERAEQDGTAVYPITLGTAGSHPRRGIAAVLQNQGARALHRLADVTGGRMFAPSSVAELHVVFKQLEEELRSQYLLGFTPPPTTAGERRRINVAVRRAGVTVRARAAYLME